MTSCKRNLGVEEALVVLAAVVNGCSQWTKKKGTFWCRENEVKKKKKKQIIDGAMNLHNTNVVHWSERSFISHLLSSACMFTAEKKKEMCKRNLHLGGW